MEIPQATFDLYRFPITCTVVSLYLPILTFTVPPEALVRLLQVRRSCKDEFV